MPAENLPEPIRIGSYDATPQLPLKEQTGDRAWYKQLDTWVENPDHRAGLAQEIHAQKAALLTSLGIAENYEGELSIAGDVVRFTHPETIETAIGALATQAQETAREYRTTRNRAIYTKEYATLAALTELTLMGPKALGDSHALYEKKSVPIVGIQPKQIEAALAIGTGHAGELASGQGKSFGVIPLAAVGRRLLEADQVHIMVPNPGAVTRDLANIEPLTNALGLRTEAAPATEKNTEEIKRLQALLTAKTIISHAELTQAEKQQYSKLLTTEIEDLSRERLYETALKALTTHDAPEPDIVFGQDRDFVFNFIGNRDVRLWPEGKTFLIADEGDLPWERGSPYEETPPGADTLREYMPDWIGACVTAGVCTRMEAAGQITQDDKRIYQFVTADGTETEDVFIKNYTKHLADVQRTGQVSKRQEAALQKRLERDIDPIFEEFAIPNVLKNEATLQALIRSYSQTIPAIHQKDPETFDKGEFLANEYQYAWRAARQLVAGSQYRADQDGITIIDPLTGWELRGHRFAGYLDLALDVKEGVCTLKPQGSLGGLSRGFYHFLEGAYGRSKYALVSGTLSHLAGDIQNMTDKPLIVVEPWIGKVVEPPPAYVAETFADAVAVQLGGLKHHADTGQPLEIICENDLELKALHQAILSWKSQIPLEIANQLAISLVTSDTPQAQKEAIYAQAGQKFHITLTNPSGARIIHINTPPEVDAIEGLAVEIWGPLTHNAVLRQAIARTQRVGHPGTVSWIVYKHGGHVGLMDNPAINVSPELTDAFANLQTGETIDYEQSPLEKLHTNTTQRLVEMRLSTYLRDRITAELYSQIMAYAKPLYPSVTGAQSVTDDFLRGPVTNVTGELLQQTADDLSQSLPGARDTYNTMYKTLSSAKIDIARARQAIIRDLEGNGRDLTNALREHANAIADALHQHLKLSERRYMTPVSEVDPPPEPPPYYLFRQIATKVPIKLFIEDAAKELAVKPLGEFAGIQKRVDLYFPTAPDMLMTIEYLQGTYEATDQATSATAREFRVWIRRLKNGAVDMEILRKLPVEDTKELQAKNTQRIGAWRMFLRNTAATIGISPQMGSVLSFLDEKEFFSKSERPLSETPTSLSKAL